MKTKYKFLQLSIMMLLQYMLFAVWWVPFAAYLSNLAMSPTQKSLILSSMAIGSMASPIIGAAADRYFRGEKVLFTSNLITAVLLVIAANISSPGLLFLIIILTMLCYMPTWSLTSSIAMAHIPSEQFPRIRVFGSVGWVASGLFSFIAVNFFKIKMFDGTALPLYCGAATSLLAAIMNLFLPTTPPLAKNQKTILIDALGLRAFTLLKDKNFLFFIALSFLSVIPFSLYHVFGSEFLQSQEFQLITFTMNLGQVVEIFVMIVTTSVIIKVGIKWALAIGLIAIVVRYFSFYLGVVSDNNVWHIMGIIVHGIIFGFFYVGGQVYTDKKVPRELKAQAQGFLAFIVWGIGLFLAILFNGSMIGKYSSEIAGKTEYQWNSIFIVTTGISIAILIVFLIFFKEENK